MLVHPAVERTTVVIADPDPAHLDRMAALFERSGYLTRSVGTGVQAIEAVCRDGSHVALLSLQLRDLNGYAIARTLRERLLPAQPVLVAMDAYADTKARFKSAAAGFDLYLSRPVDHHVFELLPTLLKQRSRFEELKAVQADAVWEFIYLEIEMGNTYLKLACTTTDPQARSRRLAKARLVCEVVHRTLQQVDFEHSELDGALSELQRECDRFGRC
jgi:CheY-like chemotaxis protein